MSKTPAGARTGATPPTPDNGDTDLNVTPDAETPAVVEATETDTAPEINKPADQTPDAGEGGTVAPGTDPSNVKRISVKTTGDHMFSDPYTREQVDAGETKSIIHSTFVENALASGQLEEA